MWCGIENVLDDRARPELCNEPISFKSKPNHLEQPLFKDVSLTRYPQQAKAPPPADDTIIEELSEE